MQRYGLSARSFVNLVTTLMKKNLITKKDLDKRKEIAVQRDLAKESQFLSSLYICRTAVILRPFHLTSVRPVEQIQGLRNKRKTTHL